MTLLIQFLSQIRIFVKQQNGIELRKWLQVEPNASKTYYDLASELKTGFRKDGAGLDDTIEKCLPEDDDVSEGEGTPWPSFVAFIKDYLMFWRDVDFENLLDAHTRLTGLVNSCSGAFTHPMYGGMLLHTAMSLCETLSRLTMMVHRRPDLTVNIRKVDMEEDKTIAEVSAEIIQKIFTTCLTERGGNQSGKPEGKKVGVYMFANLVLKLLFACRRTHLANQIFTNISTARAHLSRYPAAQRVTFLYYLGRFNFSNAHYVRAAMCLERAYIETPSHAQTHRHAILTYLIPSMMLSGRLPTAQLLARPEAADRLAPLFTNLSHAIRKGDFVMFQQTVASHEEWLFEKGLFIPLSYRLRPLLWRSLARRVFMVTYADTNVDEDPNATARKAATLELTDLLAVAGYIQRKLQGWHPPPPARARPSHVSPAFMKAVANDTTSSLVPPDGPPRKLRPHEGLVCGDEEVTYQDIEMVVAGLVMQGFMKGYIAHSAGRFAIMGAAKVGPVAAGWPEPWTAIRERTYEDGDADLDDVPGWVRG